MNPIRIQRKRSKGWRMPENTIYVGRGSKWGNPFIAGTHGTRAECVSQFRYLACGYLVVSENNLGSQKSLIAGMKDLDELRGKNLACWCNLESPCHADILLKMANGL